MRISKIPLILGLFSLGTLTATCAREQRGRPIRFNPPPVDVQGPEGGEAPHKRKQSDILNAQAAHAIRVNAPSVTPVNETQFFKKISCRPGFMIEKIPVGKANARQVQIATPYMTVSRQAPDKISEVVSMKHRGRECKYSTETLDRLFVADRAGIALRKSYSRNQITIRYYELAQGCQPRAQMNLSLKNKKALESFERRLQSLPECPN